MTASEPIAIQAPTRLAKLYRDADAQEQRKLDLILSFRLQDAVDSTRTPQEVMRDISRKAIERGMTPEIFADILAEPRPSKLPEWCNVYEGLTDQEVDDIESAIVRGAGPRTGESRYVG